MARRELAREEFARASVRCWACSRPLESTGDPKKPGDHFCYGCGEFFCDAPRCPAAEHNVDVPLGSHFPDAHVGEKED